MRTRRIAALIAVLLASAARAQDRAPAGREIVGLPALNFDSDEGVGYGALLQVYDYGKGVRPYRYTFQPTLIFSTKGKRDLTVFIEAPDLRGWRANVYLAREIHLATPYYGYGNASLYDSTAESDPNHYYYRYGRRRTRIAADVQHHLGSSRAARVLIGAAFLDVTTKAVPFDSGTTLFAQQQVSGGVSPHGRANYVRGGVVWDTRDREIGPTRGIWAEALAQFTARSIGASNDYQRYTATVRGYAPVSSRLIGAIRVIAQQVSGNVPVYDITTIQSSYKPLNGLGGDGTVRGVVKDRFIGKGLVVANTELRWRFADFHVRGKSAFLLASGFYDAGRVWANTIDISQLATELHTGYGGGLRVGLGPSFVVAVDVAHSSESTAIYIGLGYPF
jgi:outer membrane protein assembly factor BamA